MNTTPKTTPRRLTASACIAALSVTLCGTVAGATPPAGPATSSANTSAADAGITSAASSYEKVFVETTTDTDGDGELDRVHVWFSRPEGATNVPVAFQYSPYFGGVNDVPNHNVMFDYLPQDGSKGGEELSGYFPDMKTAQRSMMSTQGASPAQAFKEAGYALVYGFSIGNGESTGCPTTGDMSETLGAKAVIDWLNGRAKAVDAEGNEVKADWASGDVGMYGVSYNGTLPNMVATTGVEGLKAIIPVAAISNWYDYYRANGLVVSPGGYPGEDADVLARFVLKNPACAAAMDEMEAAQDRATGDYNEFWQARNYLPAAKNVEAAVFVMHGQSDWNVRQKHAIQWWNALEEAGVPRRMWLHNGGHDYAARDDRNAEMVGWFDQYVKGVDAGMTDRPAVEVQDVDGNWTSQAAWPHENTTATTLRFSPSAKHEVGELVTGTGINGSEVFTDHGNTRTVEDIVANPTEHRNDRVAYVGAPFEKATLLSGTPHMKLTVAVENRHAANVTVAVVDYAQDGTATVVTRGWADPQNHASIERGEQLKPGTGVNMAFTLEPKQYTFAEGHRLGVVIMSTDQEHTIRPEDGATLRVGTGSASSIRLNLAPQG